MAGVNVYSLETLVRALADRNVDEILWTGPAQVDSVTLSVASSVGNVAYPINGTKTIDFDGLVVDTVYTSGTKNWGPDETADEQNSERRRAWVYGFRVFGGGNYGTTQTNKIIKNLTVNHIVLGHPRDIILDSGNFINCYFYDIYSPSADMYSPWLAYSGSENTEKSAIPITGTTYGYKLRTISDYVFGWTGSASLEYGYTPNVIFKYCILKIRTENAGISFPRAAYIGCELTYDYELNWDYDIAMQQATVEYSNLALFPNSPFYQLLHSDLRINVVLNSDWPLRVSDKLCDRLGYISSRGMGGNETLYQNLAYVKEAVIIPTIKKGKDHPAASIIENLQYFYGQNADPQHSGEDRPAVAQFGYGLVFVTNGGDVRPLNSVPDELEVLYGDLRNPDIMTTHGCIFIDDEGYRKAQYDLAWNDYSGTYASSTIDDDDTWYRRRYAGTNDGIPFLPLWYYPYHDTPSGGGTVDGNYISVYDMDTEQDGFDNNGLILEPTQCRVVEELNGGYNLTLEHPYDKDGKWRYILEHNIIKCMGQLFIIRKVSSTNKANSKSVTAYAEHISYHLQDYWLFPGTSIAGYVGQTLIDSILAQMWDVPWDTENNLRYTFSITTDLSADETFREWYEMPEGHTPYEMILGSNGFTHLIGGELYRDNFTISIHERMEGAQDNAFILHPDLNLKSIQKTVDLQTFCTYFRGYDPYGNWFAIAWDPRTLPRAYPHNIVRSQNFTFDVAEEYYDFAMLARKVGEYFKTMCAPLVSFKIQVQDLKNHFEYKDFVNNYRFKVGDIGKVWDDDAERYYDLEITRTVKDGITGECIEVTIGTERSFTRPNGYPITIDRNYKTVDGGEYHPEPGPEPDPPSADDYIWVQDNDRADTYLYKGDSRRIEMPSEFLTATLRTIKATTFCDNSNNILQVVIPEGTEVIE